MAFCCFMISLEFLRIAYPFLFEMRTLCPVNNHVPCQCTEPTMAMSKKKKAGSPSFDAHPGEPVSLHFLDPSSATFNIACRVLKPVPCTVNRFHASQMQELMLVLSHSPGLFASYGSSCCANHCVPNVRFSFFTKVGRNTSCRYTDVHRTAVPRLPCCLGGASVFLLL